MKKLFFKLSMLLFMLSLSINAAWADFSTKPYYVAQLTASASSTGGGKVYLDAGQNGDNYEPQDEDFVDSDTRTKGLALSMQGMDRMRVAFTTWQKADDGYYFVGWSYADNGFDLGMRKPEEAEQDNFSDLYDVGTEKSTYETVDPENEDSDPVKDENGNVVYVEDKYFPAVYTLYATFEPIRIAGFEIGGSNTITDGTSCTQTVTFDFVGEDIDADDFESLAITSSTGGGAWTNASGEALSISDLDISGETAKVEVKFTAPNTNIAEYTANLRLTTQANITMNVLLGARIIEDGVEAIRLNKSKVQYDGEDGSGTLESMLTKAVTGDIIKLNGNYSDAVEINKNITFDLNGYELSNTLTVSGGNVTVAFSNYGGSATSLTVNGGKAILNGGTFGTLTIGASGTVEQNGATIDGTAENNGSLTTLDGYFQDGLTSAGTLIVNGGVFEGEIAINITGGSAQIKKGSIYGTLYGVQTDDGSTTIEKLAEIGGYIKALYGNGDTLTVNNGKFVDPENLKDGSITFYAGYFQTNNSEEDEVLGKHVWRNTSGAEFREGYEFFVGSAESAKAAGVSVCHIGGTSYAALEDALAYANTTSDKVIIIMDNDYTMPAGYYTLPDNAVLIIPKNNDQGNETKTVERAIYSETPGYEVDYVTPTKFRCLTLSEGVNLDVHGTIEVSGTQFSSHHAYTSAVYGPYGQLQMNKGSKITLQDGSELRAWGYVTGDLENQDAQHNVPMGEIDARRGAMVREQFQMGDWKGARFSGMGLLEGNPVFPLNTYFIQNIEVPVKYHPGAVLSTAAGVTAAEEEWGGMASTVSGILGTANISMSANDIKVIGVTEGEPAMFLMDAAADAENTWVRKWYDASKDQQVYEINSGAHIGNLIIPLVSSPLFTQQNFLPLPEDLTMNSGQYFLPITNNFKLHLLSGIMDFTQSTELLPGAEVEIDKESRVYITPTENVNSGALFVYDADDWGNYAGAAPARKVKYAPSFDDGENYGVPSTRGITQGELKDATVLVHGTFEITEGGYVYTSEHGANIISKNEDAGTFAFFADNTIDNQTVSQVSGATGGGQVDQTFYPAKLKNRVADPAFAETSGIESGHTLMYLNDKWIGDEQILIYLDCYTAEFDQQKYAQAQGGTGTYEDAVEKIYIKPQEYVEIAYSSLTITEDENILSIDIEGNPNHTFSDAAGAGRLFIQVGDNLTCQWWEVEAKDNYYHCIHPDNDTYYEWNESESQWEEVRFEITWLDWDGSPILDANDDPIVYEVPYGTQAEWLSTNPTREPSDDYTYDFTGWSPALGKVTSDVTYMATYEEKQIKYTIVFVNDGGVEIERHLLARDEVPVCENAPTRTGYILQWSPNDPAPVTGDETYTATWLPEPPTTYTITFKNYDGSQLEQKEVNADETPEYTGEEFSKPETDEYSYTFSGWKPAIAPASSNATYVAQFVEEPRQYEVNFYQEDKETLIETQSIPYGGMPVIPDYTKQNTAQYTYSIQWKNMDGDDNIQPVIEDVDYYADTTSTTNKYNVKLISNPSGACTLIGNGIYEYDEAEDAVTITITPNDGYEFTSWSDGVAIGEPDEGVYTRQMPITGDINLVANFSVSDPDYTIHWWNEDGSAELVEAVDQKANTNTIYPGATPTKDATAQYTYTFDGWSTSVGGDRAYKNNMTPVATENANYYAHFAATVNTYEVTLTAAPVSAATFSGLGTYLYNENANAVTLTVIPNAGYTFTGWSDGQEGTNLVRQMAITGDINLVANFTVNEPDYTITWMSEDGSQTLAEVGYKYKTPSTYTGETPTKDANEDYIYTFDGWTSEADGAGTYYANGATPKVMANATYFAHFAATPIYTITWLDGDDNTLHTDVLAYGAMPSYDGETPTKSATAEYTYTFNGSWSPSIVVVNGDATYTAQFDATPIYTITWLDGDGNTLHTDVLAYGAMPSYDGETPTKSPSALYIYTFNGTWSPSIVPVNGDATYTAQFDEAPNPAADLEIGVGESEDLNDEVIERTNLVITSNGIDASGQLLGAENLTITGEAIFRLEQDFADATWYAVAVPWTVDPATGIYNVAGTHLPTGNVYVIEFNASAYASANRQTGRTDYWKFLDVTGNDMLPGKLYMVYLSSGTTALEFHKKADASIWTTSTSVEPASGSVTNQENWNAIANPALYHANMETGAADGDVLKYNGNDSYVVASSDNMVVGQPIFAQVSTASTVAAEPVGGGAGMPAYRRAPQESTADNRFVVELTHNGNLADRLIVQTADEKVNEYVIGKDLAKMSVSTKVAQMWMNRYDAKLCKNTVEMTGDHADYSLGISAPVAGEYVLTAAQQRGDKVLYLTHNGQAIWNLSESDFVLSLEQGAANEYGLRVSTRAPQTTTGVDEAVVDAQGQTCKVLIEDKVFIIRGDKAYSIDGQLVK